ncbi:RagB/SusD family nutrient uptake outer membrane protein [Gaetbulibacter sp. M235]|uniref:RagB/SusD family nutrient uptake outer membrane protein n=1 Tax=Gaetbulibacter sp. M235 TaxID=3126510 RepID=UPI00374F1C18
MKNIIYISMILLLTISCTNLNENLYDKVSSDEYGKTPDEINTIIGSAYASLRGFNDGITISYPNCEYVFFLNEIASDEACIATKIGGGWYDGGVYIDAQKHTWTPDNRMILASWRYCFVGISKVNSVIFQVEQSNLSDEQMVPIKAELRAIRAYYYYILLDMFGNVPIVTNYDVSELPANSTRNQVFEFVESELNDIIADLPTGAVWGKFTQNVANTLMSRLYLNAEIFTGAPRWQDCIAACDKVTGYILEPNYFTNFLIQNEVSRETIFAIPFDSKAGTTGNYLQSMTVQEYQKFAISPTGNYPGSPNGLLSQPGLYSSFDDNDLRKKSLLEGKQYNISTGEVILLDDGSELDYTEDILDINAAKANEGVRMYKYETKDGEGWERDHDWVVMRYSEILLMKAECFVRLGNPSNALPLVEQVRSRSGLSTVGPIDLDFINNERKFELVYEGNRRTDNIRFGDFFNPWWEKGSTEAYRGIFPIPSSVLEKNTNLVQNPGY